MSTNPYEILGVAETATLDQIKAAYKKLLAEDRANDRAWLDKINWAYGVISDPNFQAMHQLNSAKQAPPISRRVLPDRNSHAKSSSELSRKPSRLSVTGKTSPMRILGIICIMIGVLWGVMAFNLNTTVDVATGGRVHNLSLADQRQSHLMMSAVVTVIGAIFFGFGTILRSTASSTRDNRKCPYCAELVKSEAQLCKHCGRELPPQDVTSSNDTGKQSRFSRRLVTTQPKFRQMIS